ncbi:phage tail spike protein [Bacillus thuringiensis]|uniref:phage tail spike protein n=5 Tax=Bacillus thuringiensis TaxID=1428 RepID=UPI002DB67B77|nr:phage tail spike protein [Bacillus thuringiensis]MEC3222336.1 phage tail spike protein [Bacillus thuringiensis]MEC3553893.1 phage tail spike protein [Bacillus thuringiensis]MED1831802.1 phage tail spike protein [Bacillus thuringiensis]MED2058341.1 phage tail spike protein [Bacillus thuringiensis]
MRTPSGLLHVVDFKTDQILSAIQPKDYWEDKRHWEIKNNIDMLEFKTFDGTPHAITLQQQNLVLKEVRDGRIVPYVINNEVEKDSNDRSLTVHSSGAWVQIAKDGIIKPQRIESETVNTFIDIALADSKWQRGITDYSSFHTMTIDEFIDPLTFLKKIAALFELEIQYRVEVSGSRITGWYVDMINKRGRETGKEVTLGKDLVGVRRIEHSRDICTALVGFVRGEGDELITVESINNGLLYITDNDAFQRWNAHGKHKFGFYTPETEDRNMTPQRLLTLMKTELKKRVNSSVAYEVEAQSIGRIFGLAHELINEGDTIRIKDTGFTPKLYLEARVIAGDESFTDPSQDKYVFGDYREITDPNEELRKIYNRILSSLGSKQELIDQLDQLVKDANETASNAKKESEAAKTLAEKVQENLKNNTVEIIEAKNPPTTGLKPYKTLWRDISNGKPGILKIWTGADWESVVPDVESVKKETLEQVNEDIEVTKTELNQKVQEAQNQATGQFNKVQEGLQGVSRTISNIENRQGEIDKKVTQFEQDSNGFKTSIESLTKKDTDISNKLNTVESTVEGTKKTISDVQQTTSELKKTTTEIEEKAGKINEKLTSVETKVNSDKAGGRNLLLKSNVKYEKTDYLINQYSLTENFFAGEEYTFVIKGSVPQGQKFGIWQNGGSSNVGYATSVYANGITYVTFKAVAATSGNERKLSLYNYPSSTTKSVVEWVALYKGNKPQDWTAPPEEQVTTDEFTQKTTEIAKSVDGIKETITKVENNQSGFDKRVATVEKDATTIKQNVSLIQNTQTEQGRQLQEAKAGWENTAKALEGKVELKQVEDYVAGFKIPELKQTVNQNKQDLLDELANKLATEQFNQKMTLIDNRFTINEQGINAAAKKTEVYTIEQANGQFAKDSYVRDMETRLQLTEKGVSISVKENDVIAAFNMSKENITLNANRINLKGFITASHIKGQVLEGVTLKTSGNRFVEINKQDMKIFDLDRPRGYMGFMETTDGSIQPSLVLGSDNRKFAGTGSFYIYQVMPRINGIEQPSKAWATFGVSKGETAEGTNRWSSYITMQNDGGHLSAYADGQFRFKNLNDIIFESEGWASGYGYFFVTTTEPHIFTNNWGQFTFKRKGSDYKIHFVNGATDHDLIMGNAMIRSSFVQGYNNGLQIKDMMGQGWKDIELRTLRAQENINANGQMWAKAFNPTSARNMKENIKDIPFSALDKIMNLTIKQYNFKDEMYGLYQMRVNKPEEQTEPYTTKDIETYFGMIADDTDDVFTDKEKRAINLYNTVSLFIAAFQQQYREFIQLTEQVKKNTEELNVVKEENKQLKEQVNILTINVSTLTDLVQKLISEKPEQP